MSDALSFGYETGVEVHIMCPRRKNRVNYYKNIEADLIEIFVEKFGALPLRNRRRETSSARLVNYTNTALISLRSKINVGKGRRIIWAIRPMAGNTYYKHFYLDTE